LQSAGTSSGVVAYGKSQPKGKGKAKDKGHKQAKSTEKGHKQAKIAGQAGLGHKGKGHIVADW
jgi:hypothetical protein